MNVFCEFSLICILPLSFTCCMLYVVLYCIVLYCVGACNNETHYIIMSLYNCPHLCVLYDDITKSFMLKW